jgi:hypothetical protein
MTTMTTLRYPSPVIRPVPEFTVDAPEGWVASELPGSLLVLGTFDDVSPWANVILRHERSPRPMTLETVAKESWVRLLGVVPDATLIDEQVARFGDVIMYVREARLPHDDGDRRQIQAFCFGPTEDRPTLDLFEITCLTEDGDETHLATFGQIVSSFRFTD